MKFKEIPKEKVEVINSIMEGSPNSVSGSPWLSVYPCQPEEVFDNLTLINKAITAAIVASGAITLGPARLYSCDIVRKDGDIFDIDRHLLSASGAAILRAREITKDFPEHHSIEIPYYYFTTSSGSVCISAPLQ